MQRIHGLILDAEPPLPGVRPAPAPCAADVVVRVVGDLPSPLIQTARYESGRTADGSATVTIVQDVRGVMCFRYSDGTAVDVDVGVEPVDIRAVIAPGQTLDDLAVYLVGPVLGFVLRAKGILALHASAVAVDDGCVLVAGPAGSGKSTTAAALALRGRQVLADDLTAVRFTDDGVVAAPASDHLRLWPESEQLLLGRQGELDRITPTWAKLRFPLADADTPREVRAIVVLEVDADLDAPAIEPLSPGLAVATLVTLTYSNYLLDDAMRATELGQLGELVRRVPVHRVVRGVDGRSLDALCDVITGAARMSATGTSR